MSFVTCHLSHVMCHMSCVTCHVSCVMCNFLIFFFFEQNGGASWWRVFYQWGLPHSRSRIFNIVIFRMLFQQINGSLKKSKRGVINTEVKQYATLLRQWARTRRFVGSARFFMGFPPTIRTGNMKARKLKKIQKEGRKFVRFT